MDRARRLTDKELEKLEKKIAKEYSKAQKELTEKWRAYMKEADKNIKAAKDAYMRAVYNSTSVKEIDKARIKLQEAEKAATLYNPKYKEMADTLTEKMAGVNATALSYINDKVPDIYTINHNAIATKADGYHIDFTVVNEHTLKNTTMAKKLPLPKKLNVAKDKKWNAKKMNSALLQGILQGESMEKIADRMSSIIKSNRAVAMRSARTMVTEAENKGRLDSYRELEEMGAVLEKQWVATADERTRLEHLFMDGESVGLDEPFSNGLMYPGDPDGEPEEVYNCRCTMDTVISGFKDEDGNIEYVDKSLHDDEEHQDEVMQELDRRAGEDNTELPDVDVEGPSEITVADDEFNKEEWLDNLEDQSMNWGPTIDWGDEWVGTLTDDEYEAVRWYTKSYYREINGYLRGISGYEDFYEADRIDTIRSALDKSVTERDIIVRRGGDEEGLAALLKDKEAMERIEYGNTGSYIGMIANDKGFTSTSPFKSGGFDGDVEYIIKVPKGTSGAAYVDSVSYYTGELELLLHDNSYFRIHDIDFNSDGNIRVFMSKLNKK